MEFKSYQYSPYTLPYIHVYAVDVKTTRCTLETNANCEISVSVVIHGTQMYSRNLCVNPRRFCPRKVIMVAELDDPVGHR